MRLIDAESLMGKIPIRFIDMAYLLSNEPTVDAELVTHSFWDVDEENNPVCANCGSTFHEDEMSYGIRWVYCPSCGARMEI